MSLETIRIFRDLNVINGFVQVPPNTELDKTRVTTEEALGAISGSEEVFLSLGSGPQTGSNFGQQSWLRLPGLLPGTSFVTDPVDDLAGL